MKGPLQSWLRDPSSARQSDWGDLNTHGFATLDRLHEAFHDAQSLLVDRDTLVASKAFWGIEDASRIAPLTRLTTAEAAVFDDLRFDLLGWGVRLEQVQIPAGAADPPT